MNRIVWEGWTVQNFIDALEWPFKRIMTGQSITKPLKNRKEVKQWCMENQPYYKKNIPEVLEYFDKERIYYENLHL